MAGQARRHGSPGSRREGGGVEVAMTAGTMGGVAKLTVEL